jgi:hypothetical protein
MWQKFKSIDELVEYLGAMVDRAYVCVCPLHRLLARKYVDRTIEWGDITNGEWRSC